jgi:electron transport complex protein RnfB
MPAIIACTPAQGHTARRFAIRPAMTPLRNRIDACLPQTQCTRCGYPRCHDYATAIESGAADINRCPPGGEPTLRALAALTGRPLRPLDPACGAHEPRQRAFIDEQVCIGCRKCLDVCPVDAIVGSRKLMHTVIAAECNGCGVCLPPCPVDCIALLPVAVAADPDSPWPEYRRAETERWRTRTESRLARLAQRAARAGRRTRPAPADDDRARIRAEIAAAVARVRARRTPSS